MVTTCCLLQGLPKTPNHIQGVAPIAATTRTCKPVESSVVATTRQCQTKLCTNAGSYV